MLTGFANLAALFSPSLGLESFFISRTGIHLCLLYTHVPLYGKLSQERIWILNIYPMCSKARATTLLTRGKVMYIYEQFYRKFTLRELRKNKENRKHTSVINFLLFHMGKSIILLTTYCVTFLCNLMLLY